MIRAQILMFCFVWAALSIPSIRAQDLSKYRDFQLGMNLPKVAEQAGFEAAQAKLIHERPAVIQEFEWRLGASIALPSSTDPVSEILFGFYNNQLYRIVIKYDLDKTNGLSDQDLIEGISAKYGKPTLPDATIISSSSGRTYEDNEKVIARWEDPECSLNLFRSSYRDSYGMIVFSKRLDILAKTSIAESIRLNELEAPQREIERQRKQDEEKRAVGEKARSVNKANFQP